MKNRKALVSNSSSSSFILVGPSFKQTVLAMHDVLIKEAGIWSDDPKEDSKWLEKLQKEHIVLEQLCDLPNVVNGETGVAFCSCNYNTYMILRDGKVWVSTCRNTLWEDGLLDEVYAINHGGGDDDGDDTHMFIERCSFWCVEDQQLHPWEECDKVLDREL